MKKIVLLMCLISCLSFANLDTELRSAVNDKDLTKVSQLLEKGVKVNYVSNEYQSPLIIRAIQNEDLPMIKLLVSKGAKLDIQFPEGTGPIEYAKGSDILQYLIENGAKFANPLNQAAFSGDLVKLKKMIENGDSVDAENKGEFFISFMPSLGNSTITPLMAALYKGNLEVMNYLIQMGANIESTDENGKTPLAWAIINRNKEAIDLLVKTGVNFEKLYNGTFSPVLIACSLNYPEIVEQLLSYGAKINPEDSNYNGYICCAIYDSVEVAELLIKKNYPLVVPEYSQGLIFYAAENNSIKVGKLLIKNKIDINDTLTYSEETPLFVAVEKNNKEFVELLIDSGADITKKYGDKSLLNYTNDPNMRKLLLAKGIKW